MERRKSSSKHPKIAKRGKISAGKTDARKRSAGKNGVTEKPRPKKTNIAKTALGAEPDKRGRKLDAPMRGEASSRELNVHVKTAKRREYGSTLWLKRQLNDPYVRKAKAEGYRSRAAYKLIELDEQFSILKAGARIVDLGCAPGGWLQVASKRLRGGGKLVGIDYLAVPAIEGAEILELDFLDETAPDALKKCLGGQADLVLSDMAAPTTGHKSTDHLRIVALAEAALDFAEDVLAPGGAYVCKVFAGGAEGSLLTRLKANFKTVKHAKPKSSRADSSEKYVVATGFRGGAV